ncbi:hypothetical protein PM082_004678 [Marasmius tenuissimus]|nr:hypothetical protein PM082_004678 [Marasmius tenuissimus]
MPIHEKDILVAWHRAVDLPTALASISRNSIQPPGTAWYHNVTAIPFGSKGSDGHRRFSKEGSYEIVSFARPQYHSFLVGPPRLPKKLLRFGVPSRAAICTPVLVQVPTSTVYSEHRS